MVKRRYDQVSQAVLLAMVCVSPWAFGGVRAWAELGLYAGVTLAAGASALAAREGEGEGRGGGWRSLTCVPSLALAGLAMLALVQGLEWPGRFAAELVPSLTAFKASLAPAVAARVLGDWGGPVGAPSLALSQYPELSIDAAMRLAAGWALFQVVMQKGGERGRAALRRLGLVLAANVALVAFYAVVHALSSNGRMYWITNISSSRTGGPFMSKNHLAAYLNLGLGFSLSALLVSGGRVRGLRLMAAYLGGLTAVGVIASLSRGGFVGMLSGTAVLLIVSKVGSARVGIGAALTLGLGAVFLASVGIVVPFQRLSTLLESSAYLDRIMIWKIAMSAWSFHPFLGLGLGTFAYAGRFFANDDGCFVGHTENEYLEILVEGGVIGLALAVVLLVSVLRSGMHGLGVAKGLERVPILGAVFGIVALATQCLGDFPLHIPAISVTAVILAAHLVREGRGFRTRDASALAGGTVGASWAAWVPVVVSVVPLWHGLGMAQAEAAVLASGVLPPAGYAMPTAELWNAPVATLDRAQVHLEEALQYRPDWAEGHVRLGIVLLSRYRAAVAALLADRGNDPLRVTLLSDPLRLHDVIRTARPEEIAAAGGGVLAHELIRRDLVPAARCFLEARRCCPVWGLPHAELATLDYLLPGGEPTSVHARRALRLAGPDGTTLALAAQAAAQAGDLGLAALCWRQMLPANATNWSYIAPRAARSLSPEQILDGVITDGRFAVLFADKLYQAPADRPSRDRFLRWALAHLPGDQRLNQANRLAYEAKAQAGLGNADLAYQQMTTALSLEPAHAGWRKELVQWLIGLGKLEEAHEQALLGLYLTPNDPEAKQAAALAADALARGSAPPADQPPL